MHVAKWFVLACTLSLICGVEAIGQNSDRTLEALRSFAQKQLSGSYVQFITPYKGEIGGELSYHFGNVIATAEPVILMQLRVELLRKHSFFGQKQTELMLSELEATIEQYLRVQSRLDQENPEKKTELTERLQAIELDFKQILTKHVMDYAEQNRLNLKIGNAFCDGEYLYVDKKRRLRRDVGYDEMVKVVATEFDQDRVEFVRPTAVIRRQHGPLGKNQDVIQFDPGNVIGLENSRLAVADLFRLELLRRYPNVDKSLFLEYIKEIEISIKKEYEKQKKLEIYYAMSPGNNSLSRLLGPMYKAAAESKKMNIYSIQKYAMKNEGVIIDLADDIDYVLFAPALDVIFAKNNIINVRPERRTRAVKGDYLSIEPGEYCYQLTTKTGVTRINLEGFEIPQKITRNHKLPLR